MAPMPCALMFSVRDGWKYGEESVEIQRVLALLGDSEAGGSLWLGCIVDVDVVVIDMMV